MIRTRWALATLLATCLFGACSDDDPEPDIADPTSSSALSSSATVSPSPTTVPTQTLTPRESVDAWLAAWTLAMQSGDTTVVGELSTRDCASCQRLIRQVADLYEKGGHLDTDGWTATRVGEAPDSADETPSFVMQVLQAHQVLYDETGNVVDDTKAKQVPMRMTFGEENGVWLLSRLEILE
jgi:hypothetical protein